MARTVPALTLDGLAAAPWALERAVLAELVQYAQSGEQITAAARQPKPARNSGAIAVIPIHGVIEHRSSFLLDLMGGTSVEEIRGQLRQAVADPQFSAIVLDIDSPGGGVAGITELATEIRNARASKRIVAVANTTAASAAYWLASQAHQVLVTPSGQVGSVGVFAVHYDASAAYEAAGVKPTIISAGERKADGNEFEPLTDAARSEMQARVDAFYTAFVNDVAKGRGITAQKVRDDYGQGAVLLAPDALKAGLVDGIATLEQSLSLAARPLAPNARAEDGTPAPEEIDLPFRSRVEQAADELAALVEHAEVRARLRAKEGRPAFSDHTEASLRSIRDALTALLADEPPVAAAPSPPVEPVAPAAPVTAAPAAFPARSEQERAEFWERYIQ